LNPQRTAATIRVGFKSTVHVHTIPPSEASEYLFGFILPEEPLFSVEKLKTEPRVRFNQRVQVAFIPSLEDSQNIYLLNTRNYEGPLYTTRMVKDKGEGYIWED
jgi:hypothetical protein